MGEEQKRIWEYFLELATREGTKSDGNKNAFSLDWVYKYYQDDYSQLNEITRAFLGDISPLSLADTNISHISIDDYLVEPDPNPEQEEAIRTALSKPVSFIEGPPGTGKSRTILNIMSCITNGLNQTVAMVSANNAAVGVISDKVNGYGDVNDPENTMLGPTVQCNRARLNENYAALGRKEKVQRFCRDHHINPNFEYNDDPILGVNRVTNVRFSDFSRTRKAITSTIHSLKKLFAEGPNVQYDYVIIDESSQVNPMVGIVAMTSARHLVLVGDSNQLPPIISEEDVSGLSTRFPTVSRPFLLVEDANLNMPGILKMCKERFKSSNAEVMLKEHFRCHPGIVEFCNCNVYGKNLRIRSSAATVETLDYKVPIKVIWYQGDYCEKVDIGKADKRVISKRNGKQVAIFVKEELPGLLQRIRDVNDTLDSFSILSPFRGVLTELAREIDLALTPADRGSIKITVNSPADDGEDDIRIPFQTLTVYKSQGREFDLIYLLPAEDRNWERPWSQGKNLINVAVSRAKEELRVIVSTSLMSFEMQKALTRAVKTIPETPHCPENFRYVRKLVDYAKIANESDSDYVADRTVWDAAGLYGELHDPASSHHLDGISFVFPKACGTWPCDFGFYQSSVKSIFDAIPAIRRDAPMVAQEKESPLQCVLNTIFSITQFVQDGMCLYTDVMLCDLVDSSGTDIVTRNDLWAVLEEAGYETPEEYREWPYHLELQMDVVICDINRRVILMIEIDGGYHRFNHAAQKLEKQQINDSAKDEVIRWYYADVPFIRLKTDGTSCDEKDKITQKLQENHTANVFCPAQSLTRVVGRDRVQMVQGDLIRDNKLTRSPMWILAPDGESWEMTRSARNDYTRPTTDGLAAGILRHYGVEEESGNIYMNAEYLPRFSF